MKSSQPIRKQHLSVHSQRRGCGVRGQSMLFMAIVCLLAAVMVQARADAAVVGNVTISGLHSIHVSEMLDMLAIQKGKPIDAGAVREGIKRAFLKDIFEDIAVDVSDSEPADVVITVTEKTFIRKVVVEGNYAISEKLIRELFPLRQGQIMRDDLMDQSARVLKEKLAYYGFPHSTAALKTQQTSAPYQMNLVLHVETGVPLLITDIRISGEGQEMKDILRISQGDIYDQKKLQDELRRLRELLKKEGYYGPKVGPYTYRDGNLNIDINRGKRLEVQFEGNSALSGKRLAGEMTFFETETVSAEMIDEAVSKIVALYHLKGYPFVQIAPVINEDDKNISITFFIFEGSRIRTRSVSFVGAEIPEQTLKDVMSLKEGDPYNPDLIERDREALAEFYAALGYLDAVIKSIEVTIDREQEAAFIMVPLTEGIRTLISAIEIAGVGDEIRGDLQKILNIRIGDPYNELDISDARFRILDFYVGRGYTHIDVTIDRTIADKRAAIRFVVAEGKKVFIGKTVIAGNERTRYEAIKRELSLREGQPYSFRTLTRERQKLYKMGLFADVEVDPVDATKDVTDILVHVTEGNAGIVDFGFGIADYEKFRAFFEVGYRNLWGMNRQGLLHADLSSLHRRAFAQYQDPWLFGSTLPFRAILLFENKKEIIIPGGDTLYKLRRMSASAGVEKKLQEKIKLELFYEFSLNNTTEVSSDAVLSKEDTGTVAISALRSSLIYDSRDNALDPSKGIVAGINTKWATPLLFSESEFVKFTVFGSVFERLSKRVIAAFTTSMGIAYGLGDIRELPIIERYFLGGRSSVRGYAQDQLGPTGHNGDPIGGNASFMASAELRTAIGWGVSIVPFVDCGNVWIDAKEFSLGDLKYTAGLGLRYATPVGPLRIDYGFKLNREKGESSGELHFSIGQAF